MIRDVCPSCVFSRAFYVVVVPLKKQRTGKFLKPWDNPDEMNLEEVRSKFLKNILFYFPSVLKELWGGGDSFGAVRRAGAAGDEAR